MVEFFLGVLAGVVAAFLYSGITTLGWPTFKNKYLYQGINVSGSWDIFESRQGNQIRVGRIAIEQQGCSITGSSTRTKTRDGRDSERTFKYLGFIRESQLTLTFEDIRGTGFDTGTYVFAVHNDGKTMEGMATFCGRVENKIVSEPRRLVKIVS